MYNKVRTINIDTTMNEGLAQAAVREIGDLISKGYETKAVMPFGQGSVIFLFKTVMGLEDE